MSLQLFDMNAWQFLLLAPPGYLANTSAVIRHKKIMKAKCTHTNLGPDSIYQT